MSDETTTYEIFVVRDEAGGSFVDSGLRYSPISRGRVFGDRAAARKLKRLKGQFPFAVDPSGKCWALVEGDFGVDLYPIN